MKRILQITADGSHTIAIAGTSITYHSIYGAMQESKHVFINAGLEYILSCSSDKEVNILEVGLGTGLNALLSCKTAASGERCVFYEAIELYPLTIEETKDLNYSTSKEDTRLLELIHAGAWGKYIMLDPFFTLYKSPIALQEWSSDKKFHLIYFDAFAPDEQPEMWEEDVLSKMYDALMPGGVLVTYCSKGVIRRRMQKLGFEVEKLKGAQGKREMLRAIKPYLI